MRRPSCPLDGLRAESGLRSVQTKASLRHNSKQVRATNFGEGELVERVRAGDARALGELLEKVRPRVRAICRWTLGSAASADVVDDLTQDTLIRAIPPLIKGDYDPDVAPLIGWLGRISARVCCDYLRKDVYGRQSEPLDGVRERGVAFEDVVLRALDVQACLGGLDEDDRRLILLLEVEEAPYSEAAEALGCAVGTVGSRRNRVMLRLKRCLESRLITASTKDRTRRRG